jgi:hypothetical protein
MADIDETDRAAILARRRSLIAAALARLEAAPIGPRTGVAVAAVATLATACPCLSISRPTDADEHEPPTEDSTDTTGTDTGETTGPGTEGSGS